MQSSVESSLFFLIVLIYLFTCLGGSPYPLLTNAELMRLLKTGHRMEKPELCSDHVYVAYMKLSFEYL